MTELISKNKRHDLFDKDLRVLSVSSRDLSKPFKGGTRLILSSIGALALEGYKTTHLYLTPKIPREPYSITVTDGKRESSIHIIEVFRKENSWNWINWFKDNKLVKDAVNKLYERPDIIICERRPFFLFCFNLTKYLKIPLILRIDALYSFWALERARYTKSVVPLLKAPLAIISYALMAKYADYGICVTKVLEKKLRHLGMKNIITVEPTHLTVSEIDRFTGDDFELDKDIATKDYAVISSKDYRIIKLLASKTPDIRYVIIGEHPQKGTIKDLPTNIIWTGTISDQKLIKLYEKALCIIIYRPWLSGISMSLLETLRYGRPCIINSGAVSNLINGYENADEGFLVADDVFTWLTLLKKLRDDKLFKSQLEMAARRFFDGRFSWEFHATKMKQVFDILLKKT